MQDLTTPYPIPNFDGYWVNRLGEVFSSVKRRARLHLPFQTDGKLRKLKQGCNENGYPQVTLFTRDRSRTIKVCHLVMLTFVGPRPRGLEVCHENRIRSDSRLDNLRYDTRAGNVADMEKHGTVRWGTACAKTKLTPEIVLTILARLKKGEKQAKLAKEYNVSRSAIWEIKSGKSWSRLKEKVFA